MPKVKTYNYSISLHLITATPENRHWAKNQFESFITKCQKKGVLVNVETGMGETVPDSDESSPIPEPQGISIKPPKTRRRRPQR